MNQIKKRLMNRRIKKAIWAIKMIDKIMKDMKMPRTFRRQIWRGIITSEEGRKDVAGLLEGIKQ